MSTISALLLETPTGELIFQHRDNIPTITDPNMISTFGGHQELGESAISTAIRELEEETTLKISASKLEPFAYFSNSFHTKEAYIFVVRNVNASEIEVREGQGMVLISKTDDLTQINLAPFARYLINLFWKI